MWSKDSHHFCPLWLEKNDSKTCPGAVTSNWIPVQSAFTPQNKGSLHTQTCNFTYKINLKSIKQQWNILELQSVMRKNGNYIVLQIQQNEFWTRAENKTLFRSDSVIVHLHYTGTTSVADFCPHYYKTAWPRTQFLKHRNSTVGQSGRQKHVWCPNFYLIKVKITSTAKIFTQALFLHWSHPDYCKFLHWFQEVLAPITT